ALHTRAQPPARLAPPPTTVRPSAAAFPELPPGARALFTGADDAAVHALLARIEDYAANEQYESAARLRDRTAALIRALRRTQRLAAVARPAELIAAHPDGAGGWEFAVVRHGRLAGAGTAARGVPPMPVVEQIVAAAQTVRPAGPEPGEAATDELPLTGADLRLPPLLGASPDEVAVIARWLERPGVRIVRTTDGYAEPARGAGRWIGWAEAADAAAGAARAAESYDEQRG
ncbi:hypothetical protein ABZ510_32360, partial [Nocardia rhamnosiphila]